MTMQFKRTVLPLFLLLSFGCGGSPEPGSAPPPAPAKVENSEPAPTPLKVDAEGEALLAKADAEDGAEDKIVTKCAVCALHMDGSEEHVVNAGEYALHMCSDSCKTHFESDPAAGMAAIDAALK